MNATRVNEKDAVAIAAPLDVFGSAGSLPASVYALAAGACLLHVAVNWFAAGRYGFFRDELYYLACGEHPAWGYVDHAPLIAVVAWVSRRLLGDSLVAIRLFPSLAAGAQVVVAACLARALGGRHFAQFLAAVTVLAAPVYLTFNNFLSMNAFEPIFWTLAALVFVRIEQRDAPRGWLVFGLVAGVGVLNKHPMVFFGSGLLAGMLLTPARRWFASVWLWLGGGLGFLIALPNLLWEIHNGWATIEILGNVAQTVNAPVTPAEFVLQQTLLIGPLSTPIWLAGLYFFFRAVEGRAYRALGWAYLVVLLEMILLKGKIYYLAPVYPILLAAGAVWVEGWVRARDWRWLKPALVAPVALTGIIAAPLAMPILPVEATAGYARFWHVEDVQVEKLPTGKLPQLFAEMFGWENQAATVARVYESLAPEERAKCAILAYNFGEAGAVDFFGPRNGLPKAISGNNNYYLWGPRNYSGEVVISFGVPRADLEAIWGEVVPAATITHEYVVPDETNLPVYICRKPKMPLRLAWPRLKTFG